MYREDSARLMEPQEEETVLFGTVVNTGIDENGAYKGGESTMQNFRNIGNAYVGVQGCRTWRRRLQLRRDISHDAVVSEGHGGERSMQLQWRALNFLSPV